MANDLESPMKSRPFNEEGRGGNHPGMKDDVAAGRPSGSAAVSSPLNNPFPLPSGPSTAGGPIGFQVTEDVQAMEGERNAFPSGTASKV